MNPLIEELIDKATTVEEPGWGDSYENFDKEKFAMLIVKECAEYVDTLLGDAENPHYPDGEMIKEHFGVKL